MYPISLLKLGIEIHPIFGEALKGKPHVFDFSSSNAAIKSYETTDYHAFQSSIVDELERNGKQWGIGRYLEERETLLRHYPLMIEEGRIYHVGLDITSPPGTAVHAPLDAEILQTGIDEGQGNYGGYVVLKHVVSDDVFYSFYGHLSSDHMVSSGDTIEGGDVFAVLGQGTDAGGWFSHVHLQIHTEKSVREGHLLQGYVNEQTLLHINDLFPSPYPLFRY